MNLARSEAITRNKQQGVILTSKGSGGNWSDGWWTWEDGRGSTANINGNRDAEEIIREASAVGQVDVFARDALTDGNAVDAVSYRSDGMLGGITEVHFFVCDAEKDRPGRYLRVRRTGRVSLENDQYTGAPCF
jgi:Tfp pilus assembly protein FimT